ncbi:MAG: hypothetical protein DI537_05255 [Stutzerimonas stutzeri]|nr:MAG: hypothetical protein DI537_05255 [Stutzerimonas stutzeri]
MPRIIAFAAFAAMLAGCAGDNQSLTTTSPGKCFYDSNRNQQICSNALAFEGEAASERRSHRYPIGHSWIPFTSYVFGDTSRKTRAYKYGYDARFESGYRAPTRFDTTIYSGAHP